MPLNFAFKMIIEALEEDNEKYLWEFYLRMVDRMDKNNFKSFEEWKSDVKKEKKMEEIKPMSKKEKSALLMKIEKIKNIDQLKKR